jgi:hypothetical protein
MGDDGDEKGMRAILKLFTSDAFANLARTIDAHKDADVGSMFQAIANVQGDLAEDIKDIMLEEYNNEESNENIAVLAEDAEDSFNQLHEEGVL